MPDKTRILPLGSGGTKLFLYTGGTGKGYGKKKRLTERRRFLLSLQKLGKEEEKISGTGRRLEGEKRRGTRRGKSLVGNEGKQTL